MPKRLYDTMPTHYPVCLHEDCPQAGCCLHQLAYATQLKDHETLQVLNPLRCMKDGNCPHFRSNEPMLYARGFASFQKKMFPDQWATFVSILRTEWGRTRFYERRRGEIAMPPSEQKFVLEALQKAGVAESFDFDEYEELLTWYD